MLNARKEAIEESAPATPKPGPEFVQWGPGGWFPVNRPDQEATPVQARPAWGYFKFLPRAYACFRNSLKAQGNSETTGSDVTSACPLGRLLHSQLAPQMLGECM